jgi:hypothetical protein
MGLPAPSWHHRRCRPRSLQPPQRALVHIADTRLPRDVRGVRTRALPAVRPADDRHAHGPVRRGLHRDDVARIRQVASTPHNLVARVLRRRLREHHVGVPDQLRRPPRARHGRDRRPAQVARRGPRAHLRQRVVGPGSHDLRHRDRRGRPGRHLRGLHRRCPGRDRGRGRPHHRLPGLVRRIRISRRDAHRQPPDAPRRPGLRLDRIHVRSRACVRNPRLGGTAACRAGGRTIGGARHHSPAARSCLCGCRHGHSADAAARRGPD